MRYLIFSALVFTSGSSFAHGVKRLTTVKCIDQNEKEVASIKWDSSISPFIPQETVIQGINTRVAEAQGSTYFGNVSDGIKFEIELLEGSKFKTLLKLDEGNIEVTCNEEVKFRLF